MKNHFYVSILLILGLYFGSYAQDTPVKGRITDSKGDPLYGVNVTIKGTTRGTTSGADGNYSINAPRNSTLVFSYIGYLSKSLAVGNQNVINLSLETDDKTLGEVVVTALGVSRDKRQLAYSITEVNGENFIKARENNLANSLAGRVAGVNVSKIATGPAGSSRVIIRGNKSLQGNNQPLYVVDGIPMDNSNFGQAGLWGGSDEGDALASINPDDIESITVLKGANAAALYGARAANGVINVVTKKGSRKKGVGIEFSSQYVMERHNDLSDLQQSYGSGDYVNGVPTKATTQAQAYNWQDDSWGPKFDGSSTVNFDGVSRPYAYAGDNWSRYLKTGKAVTNNIAFTGGNETQSFRFSVTDLRSTTIIPNAGFDRTNLTLSTLSKFGKKVTLDAKVMYSLEKAKNRPRVSDSPGNGLQSIWRMPPDQNVLDYYGDPNKPGAIAPGTSATSLSLWGKEVGEEFQQAANNWGQNPYWTAYQFINTDKKDRIITSARLRYDILDWLYIQGLVGLDRYDRRATDLTPQGTGYQRGGALSEQNAERQEINGQLLIGMDKQFGKINVSAFGGTNVMRNQGENIDANGNGFNVAFFPAINNAKDRNYGYGFYESGINSLLGQVVVNYDNYLSITATARNDWFSVLNPEYNSILYPSIGGAFVFTDAFRDKLPAWLTYGKLRASWAQVGNATVGAYSTNLTYSLNSNSHLGRTMGSYSSAGGRYGTIPNAFIKPLTVTEQEYGIDLRLFQGKLGLDFTYYNQLTTDDILNASISSASGFGSTLQNLGRLRNRGIEILLSGTPFKGRDLTWDVSLNLAKNNNKVLDLIPGVSELILEEPRTRNSFIKHIVGQPFGVITGRVQMMSPDGQPVFYANGRPRGAPNYEIIGNGVADLTGGLNNAFFYKSFDLSFLIDFKMGGDILSGSNMRLTQWGLHKQSLIGRPGETPLRIKGVVESSPGKFEPVDRELTPQEARTYWGSVGGETDGVTTMFLYDASFAKLRQLTFGYSLPRKLLEKTPFGTINLSFVGRNLAILYKAIENIDPESSYTSNNSQGFDYFGFPATRSYGFNLKVTF